MKRGGALILLGLAGLCSTRIAVADELDRSIAMIAAVGPQGTGSPRAREACQTLSRRGPEILPRLLVAMDTSNIVAANWYRTAYERIISREFGRSKPEIPLVEVEAYVRDSHHAGRARRLALDLLDRVEPSFEKTLVPTLLDDPEFRSDAVAIALKQGDEAKAHGDDSAARRAFRRAFEHARKPDQVTTAAGRLEALGDKVSIVEHLGFVIDWFVVGPFPAPGMSGFLASFSPERTIDLSAPVVGGTQKGLSWSRHRTDDPLGTVDLIRILGPADEAVAYAYAEIESPSNRTAELRCSADDNLSVWLNGEKVFGRPMWLNGTRLDRFITPVRIKAGCNRVLVKICQGPHHRDPAIGNAWTFQLRFCSSDGAGLGLAPAMPAVKKGSAPLEQKKR